jgi:hypothetical protein
MYTLPPGVAEGHARELIRCLRDWWNDWRSRGLVDVLPERKPPTYLQRIKIQHYHEERG